MIDDWIYTKKRIYKNTPLFLKGLKVFDIKRQLEIDEFLEIFNSLYDKKISRKQVHGILTRLKMHGLIKHVGLKTYRLNRKKS